MSTVIDHDISTSNEGVKKNDKKVMTGWAMYDWANSVYSLSIASAIFPAFYEDKAPKMVDFMGYHLKSTALYTYFLSAAFLIIALMVPLLSGIADAKGVRKPYMIFFVLLGSLGCSSLFGFEGSNYVYGLTCFVIGTIGWAGSLVFYNSYLPEITTRDKFDRLSARGYTMGYIGSVSLLILNLLFIMKHEWFGLPSPKESTLAVRVGFLTVGFWWLGWSVWPFATLPGKQAGFIARKGANIWNGYQEIKRVFRQAMKMKALKLFLLAFFIYTMGVQTIIYVAALFGKNVLLLESKDMLITILLIQLIGIAGAYFFAWVADKRGNKISLGITLLIWAVVCILAFRVEPQKPMQFFALACLVGTVMGGIQSLSRATYAKLIPGDTDNTSYFSFYEVAEKVAIVLGTFSFAFIDDVTGDMRNSILVLMLFFILGFITLIFVPGEKLRPSKK